jgi:HEAT repeat protein
MFGLGLRIARELPGADVTQALLAELGKATPERQVLLSFALADRGDPAALPAILASAKAGPDRVRTAAIRVLEKMGNASCVPVLLDATQDANGDLAQAAVDTLSGLPGKDVDQDLAERLAKAEGKQRFVLIQVAGARRIEAAVATLLKAADDAEGQTRTAALTALGETINLDGVAVLLARVAEPKNAEEGKAAEDALRAACVRMPDREATAEKLIAAIEKAPTPVKVKLLQVLGEVAGTKAVAAVGAAAKQGSPEIQDAATKLLGAWMTPDAAPALLEVAKANGQHSVRALRGYLRIARQFQVPLEQRIAMCGEAIQIAQRPDEKKIALNTLSLYPTPEGLALAVKCLGDASLKKEAAQAAVVIGEKAAKANGAAVAEAMKKVVEANVSPELTENAQAVLEQAQKK